MEQTQEMKDAEARELEAIKNWREKHDGFYAKCEEMKQGTGNPEKRKELLVSFTEPVKPYGLGLSEPVKTLRFKTAFQRGSTWYFNPRKARRGYNIDLPMDKIASVIVEEVVDKRRQVLEVEDIERLKFDGKTWVNFPGDKYGQEDGVCGNWGGKYRRKDLRNIKKDFPAHVIEAIKEAFKNKTAYSYDKRGTKRDLSVETKMGDDGIFRAWFSSEYAGCGNGDYYLLLNPTTAIYVETD